jgi:hypothetical protein
MFVSAEDSEVSVASRIKWNMVKPRCFLQPNLASDNGTRGGNRIGDINRHSDGRSRKRNFIEKFEMLDDFISVIIGGASVNRSIEFA